MKKIVGVALVCLVLGAAAQAELPIPENPQWEVIQDDVYLQEVPQHVVTEAPLLAVAVLKDTAYAGGATGVSRLSGDSLVPAGGPEGQVNRLAALQETLWALASDGLWAFDGKNWAKLSDKPVVDLCEFHGDIIVASGTSLFRLEGNALELVADARRAILGVAPYADTLYVHLTDRIGAIYKGGFQFNYLADWGTLQQGSAIRDMQSWGSRLVLATDKGLGILRGMTWYRMQGEDGLCVEDTTSLALGFDRDLWIGTKRGAVRFVNGEYQYFGAQRWLPDNHVNAIACGDKVVYAATNGGLGVITYEPWTLQKKAEWYENWLQEWGMKRLGFTHKLDWNPELQEWIREVSDNDVGYSSHYFTSLCFKYAVTGDKVARAGALDMMKSMKWSEEITSIDGFPARSIWAVGEKGNQAQHGSGGLPAEWHLTPDGLWQWKGDTSSDETDGHNYATALFLELAAINDDERAMATDHLQRMVGHIVDNGWYLKDVDGKPTRWARWDPEYLQRPYGAYAAGLNGMEALNYVTTAYHFTGDAKFQKGKEQLIEWGYHDAVPRQKQTFHPGYFTPFDDRLAFYSFYSLVRYETDPELRSIWRMGLERSWEVKRIEGVPWFNFIYGALTGNDCESARATAHLREWPLDLRHFSYNNSHRDDLYTPKGYRMYSERIKPLSPRETSVMRWDGDFMGLNGGGGGRVVTDPASWLDAYWMGRYYGIITAPTTKDPKLITYPKSGHHIGAKPYDGPPRPPVWKDRAQQ
jgi:hypothetical protein